jgi:hypothetical protein
MENSPANRAGSAVASLLEDRFPYVDKSGIFTFFINNMSMFQFFSPD